MSGEETAHSEPGSGFFYLKNMNYSDLLLNPRWQKKRLEILNRDNWTCQLCKDTEETLHVHHKLYTSFQEPWNIDNDFLITYCSTCHEIVETFKKDDAENKILRVDKYDFPISDYGAQSQIWIYLKSDNGGFYVSIWDRNFKKMLSVIHTAFIENIDQIKQSLLKK